MKEMKESVAKGEGSVPSKKLETKYNDLIFREEEEGGEEGEEEGGEEEGEKGSETNFTISSTLSSASSQLKMREEGEEEEEEEQVGDLSSLLNYSTSSIPPQQQEEIGLEVGLGEGGLEEGDLGRVGLGLGLREVEEADESRADESRAYESRAYESGMNESRADVSSQITPRKKAKEGKMSVGMSESSEGNNSSRVNSPLYKEKTLKRKPKSQQTLSNKTEKKMGFGFKKAGKKVKKKTSLTSSITESSNEDFF